MWTILKSLFNLLQYCFCFMLWFLGQEACRILGPQLGTEPPMHWEAVSTMDSHGIPAAAAAKSRQSCSTLCDPIDGSPTGSSVPRILQARTLEWVVISFSNAWKWKVKVKSLSRVQLLATPQVVAYQALPSMRFSRQEYWSGRKSW